MNKKILIIEDDDALTQVYEELFKDKGIDVIKAASGQVGLELINSQNPDLIILDVMLPGGMNGFDVLEKIEANPATKLIPVMILTNLDSEENVAKVIGAQKYMIKANTTTAEVVEVAMDYLR